LSLIQSLSILLSLIRVTSEINTLLEKAVIVKAHDEPGEFISPIFVRPKKDGSHRMILNLKNFNEYVEYNHFNEIIGFYQLG